jgi:probable rRNA maturation factor
VARAAAGAALLRGAAAATVALPAWVELAVVLGGDAEQQRLNRDWRGIDRPTNVLAFSAWDPGLALPRAAPVLLGDVVLAFETVAREAAEHGRPLADHLSHLVVHGVLHLIGFDHQTDSEAAVMEALETSILADFGVADPYRCTI